VKFKQPFAPKTGDGPATASTTATPAPAASTKPAIDKAFDYYDFDSVLRPEEREVRDKVRAFVDAEVLPVINDYWERDETPMFLLEKLAALNLCGGSIQGYGCPGLSPLATGLVQFELTRGDGSIGTMFGVTSGLGMMSIAMCGSEAQKQHWLPKLAKLEAFCSFGLTEPYIGSDASHIQTTAKKVGDTYVLNGAKRWIGGATFADVTVVWAQDDQTGQVGGFLVEKDTPGFSPTKIKGKVSLRALPNADIKLENCVIPASNRLEKANSFRDTAAVLRATRLGVAWAAIGHAQAAYEFALTYSKKRQQFGRPIAGFQLIQDKLVRMLADLEYMKITTAHLSRLSESGKLTDGQASLAKMNNAAKARQIVALAREVHGGNGILLEHNVMRHFADMEAVYSYEGTSEINTLVVGREITGMQAFA
jgi:glutaryl-CoA dehydrogenase